VAEHVRPMPKLVEEASSDQVLSLHLDDADKLWRYSFKVGIARFVRASCTSGASSPLCLLSLSTHLNRPIGDDKTKTKSAQWKTKNFTHK
jgi:hypothetical protein